VAPQKCRIKLNNTYESKAIANVLAQLSPSTKGSVNKSYSITDNQSFDTTAPLAGCSLH